MTSIPLKDIDWWCERTKQWRNAKETAAWKPLRVKAPPVNRSSPFPAATSQAASSQSAAQSVQASIQ